MSSQHAQLTSALEDAVETLSGPGPAELISPHTITDDPRVPGWWHTLLEHSDDAAGAVAARIWNTILDAKMPRVRQALAHQCIGVRLARRGDDLFLIYAFSEFVDNPRAGDWLTGGLPIPEIDATATGHYRHLEPELQRFYTEVHDGFGVYLANGLLPLSQWRKEQSLTRDNYFFDETRSAAPDTANTYVFCDGIEIERLLLDITTGTAWECPFIPEEEGGTHVVDLWSRVDDFCVFDTLPAGSSTDGDTSR